jgi:glycogen debranching enzyme
MEKWGDSDGDLFLEYIKKKPTGLDNQGWKDSHNSIMHENGELAQPPIALCEVQAYAYRARRVMAELARVVGDQALAQKLTNQADRLRAKFQEVFWDKHDRYVYLALDGRKLPCKVMSSNQGHCLWGRLLSDEQAKSVCDHLMSARLFSGYGIRTLASDEKSFNPLSYHNGSIWPHDNSLIAEGLRFYRQTAHLQALADGLFDVLATSEDYRFPELFCGFRKRQSEPPIPYEVACRPQAWAAGSVFLLLKSLLGFTMGINQECIVFELPLLPHKVNSLEINGLRVRDTEFSALVQRSARSCHLEVTKRSGPMEIMVVK